MNVCIIGNGLTSLALAKNLVNKKINVHICYKDKSNTFPSNRTLGISKNNFEYFCKKIFSINKKKIWEIKKIEIFSEKIKKDKILTFGKNNKILFLMLKNDELYRILTKQLMKEKLFKKIIIKNNIFYKKLLVEKKYDLIINCESNNVITKKYFSKKTFKNYNNIAFTTILKHEALPNKTASQIFTKFGPIAFLPISESETSIVYSINLNQGNFSDLNIINLIKKYNTKYLIKKIMKIDKFELKSSNVRNYYYKNIIAFGDYIHKIHPLAGQGFNMTIRDIKVISQIIQNRINLGMQIDSSIGMEFEKKTKHINYIFSNGIDFIYEFFNFERGIKNENLSKILKIFGNNKILNNIITKYADRGLNI